MDGSRRAKTWGLAGVVLGDRSHHSLLVWEIMRVSLRSDM